mgnify:CR=1 FL=1
MVPRLYNDSPQGIWLISSLGICSEYSPLATTKQPAMKQSNNPLSCIRPSPRLHHSSRNIAGDRAGTLLASITSTTRCLDINHPYRLTTRQSNHSLSLHSQSYIYPFTWHHQFTITVAPIVKSPPLPKQICNYSQQICNDSLSLSS